MVSGRQARLVRGRRRQIDWMHCSEFFPLAKITRQADDQKSPTQSRAELQTRRRQWDKTSEVPEVHGASRWWALSKAVKRHSWKQYWHARARFRTLAASMPELPSAMQARKPAITRWVSA